MGGLDTLSGNKIVLYYVMCNRKLITDLLRWGDELEEWGKVELLTGWVRNGGKEREDEIDLKLLDNFPMLFSCINYSFVEIE